MIYGMKLHKKVNVAAGINALRVPGGWIYDYSGQPVFVPFNDEFGKSFLKKLYEYEPDKNADYGELEYQTEGYK